MTNIGSYTGIPFDAFPRACKSSDFLSHPASKNLPGTARRMK
jgi:hypothetical protein